MVKGIHDVCMFFTIFLFKYNFGSGFMSKKSIKILKGGPYVVSGGIEISEKIITPVGKGYKLRQGRVFEKEDSYSLCRCGNSKNAPYCDGSHAKADFNGRETASREKYVDRAKVTEGQELDMLDDYRCALARFCHRDSGSAWQLIQKTDDQELKEEAIKSIVECPAGRLAVRDKEGNYIEPEYHPEIEVLQDPQKNVSGPLSVKGGVEIESSDGHIYEKRNRITLCRCGKSDEKPFCDGMHVDEKYKDSL